jgi:hypothetical protein
VSSSNPILVTVQVNEAGKFMIPVPVNGDDLDKESTLFHLLSEDNGISLLGTFDQLIDFASDIMQKVWSWSLVSGHSDWIGTDTPPIQKEAIADGSESRDGRVEAANWQSGAGRAGVRNYSIPPIERTG